MSLIIRFVPETTGLVAGLEPIVAPTSAFRPGLARAARARCEPSAARATPRSFASCSWWPAVRSISSRRVMSDPVEIAFYVAIAVAVATIVAAAWTLIRTRHRDDPF